MQQSVLPSYKARVLEVISGDDLFLLVELGIDDLYKRVRARLHGVDTPDAYKSGESTEAGKIRNEVRKITKAKPCRIEVHLQGRGGWVVTLFVKGDGDVGEINLNESLLRRGFVYDPKKKETTNDA